MRYSFATQCWPRDSFERLGKLSQNDFPRDVVQRGKKRQLCCLKSCESNAIGLILSVTESQTLLFMPLECSTMDWTNTANPAERMAGGWNTGSLDVGMTGLAYAIGDDTLVLCCTASLATAGRVFG